MHGAGDPAPDRGGFLDRTRASGGFALGLADFARGAEGYTGMRTLRWLARLAGFMAFYLREVLLSNLQVAYDVLSPRPRMRPAILAVDLDALTDQQLIALANLITMTPGTLILDVSEDHRQLLVHAMYVDDLEAFNRDLTTRFARRIRRVF